MTDVPKISFLKQAFKLELWKPKVVIKYCSIVSMTILKTIVVQIPVLFQKGNYFENNLLIRNVSRDLQAVFLRFSGWIIHKLFNDMI